MELKISEVGVSVALFPVCDACLNGRHLDSQGYDHRKGLAEGKGDCKNFDGVVLCSCGLGGYVYNHLTEKFEEGGKQKGE